MDERHRTWCEPSLDSPLLRVLAYLTSCAGSSRPGAGLERQTTQCRKVRSRAHSFSHPASRLPCPNDPQRRRRRRQVLRLQDGGDSGGQGTRGLWPSLAIGAACLAIAAEASWVGRPRRRRRRAGRGRTAAASAASQRGSADQPLEEGTWPRREDGRRPAKDRRCRTQGRCLRRSLLRPRRQRAEEGGAVAAAK